MTPEEFIDAVRTYVLESSADGTIRTLEAPPGRRPYRAVVEASRWYHGLSDGDREQLRRVLRWTSHGAIFGLLAVLDGVRVIEDGPEKGTFRLSYCRDGVETQLNPETGEMLHDILNDESYMRSLYEEAGGGE